MKSLEILRRWATPRRLALTAAILFPLAAAAVLLAVTTEDVTQHNGLSSSDPAHLRFFIEHRTDVLVDAAKAVTMLGAAPVLALIAVTAGAVLWWRGERVAVSIAPLVAVAASAAVVSVAKTVVGRARPPLGLRLVSDTEPSFPSGHATDSTALYVTLAVILAVYVFRRPLARAVTISGAVVLSGVVGVSRLVLAAHWPTDVLAGWALGLIAAFVVTSAVVATEGLAPPHDRPAADVRARLVSALQHRRIGVHGMATSQ